MDLTYKQRLFVSYYLGMSNGNATDAARRAGFAWPDKAGAKLVGKSSIRAAIEAKLASVAMGQDEILARLGEIISASILDFADVKPDGSIRINLKPSRRRERAWLLKRLKTTKGEVDIELESKLQAIIKMGEYHNMCDRDKPPELSLVELAKKVRERLEGDRDRGDGDPGGLPGGDQG
jgi:phage terminase small subunit